MTEQDPLSGGGSGIVFKQQMTRKQMKKAIKESYNGKYLKDEEDKMEASK